MTDIDKALRGDHAAAKRLTDAGVLVPCGHCGKQAYISVDPECEPDSTGRKWAYTVVCGTCCDIEHTEDFRCVIDGKLYEITVREVGKEARP